MQGVGFFIFPFTTILTPHPTPPIDIVYSIYVDTFAGVAFEII